MIVSESDIEFTFGEQYGNFVLKYDDTPYYTERFNAQPGAKAVAFIAVSDKHYLVMSRATAGGLLRITRSATRRALMDAMYPQETALTLKLPRKWQ